MRGPIYFNITLHNPNVKLQTVKKSTCFTMQKQNASVALSLLAGNSRQGFSFLISNKVLPSQIGVTFSNRRFEYLTLPFSYGLLKPLIVTANLFLQLTSNFQMTSNLQANLKLLANKIICKFEVSVKGRL